MKYSLRSLMIVVLVGPPAFACLHFALGADLSLTVAALGCILAACLFIAHSPLASSMCVRRFCHATRLLLAFNDSKESRFRHRLRKRVVEPCSNYGVAEAALRRVFEEQLDLPNLLFSDDLVENGPDLPIKEILEDALELLGITATPAYHSWKGTFGDLVRVLDETVTKSHRELRHKAKLGTL